MDKSVFLSGKVSGLPRWWVVLKFYFWDLALCMRGYEPWNPVREIPKSTLYDSATIICIDNLRDCKYIFMIPGWRKSPGALKEFEEAASLDKEIVNKGDAYFRFLVKKFCIKNPPVPTFDDVNKMVEDLRKHDGCSDLNIKQF